MRAELRRLGLAFVVGWAFGKGIAAGARVLRREHIVAGEAPPAGEVITISVDQEREFLEERREWVAAADAIAATHPRAAAALLRSLESAPVSLYRVREERDGGVLERTVALAG